MAFKVNWLAFGAHLSIMWPGQHQGLLSNLISDWCWCGCC